MDFEEMYLRLFRKVSKAADILVAAMNEGEDAFIDGKDADITLLRPDPDQ
jgi:hypothetical protein